jgi:polar amino acid transport system substrate-binding protein
MDIPMALFHSKSRPELEVVERIPTGEQYGLMFAKGNALRDEFNDVITELKEDGTLAEIHEKWFGKPPGPETSTVVVMPLPGL